MAKTFNLIAKNAYTKEIPHQILRSPKKTIYSFLSGLIDGKGFIHDKRNSIVYVSISEKLIDQLMVLLLSQNIFSSKYIVKKHNKNNYILGKKVTTRTAYCLEIKGENAVILSSKIDFMLSGWTGTYCVTLFSI